MTTLEKNSMSPNAWVSCKGSYWFNDIWHINVFSKDPGQGLQEYSKTAIGLLSIYNEKLLVPSIFIIPPNKQMMFPTSRAYTVITFFGGSGFVLRSETLRR